MNDRIYRSGPLGEFPVLFVLSQKLTQDLMVALLQFFQFYISTVG